MVYLFVLHFLLPLCFYLKKNLSIIISRGFILEWALVHSLICAALPEPTPGYIGPLLNA